MTIYTVALPKGGSTKTTTAAELVSALARRGRRVLAIDLDQQRNFTTRMGITPDSEVSAIAADVVLGNSTARDAAIDAPSIPGAQIIVGSQHLADLEHDMTLGSSLQHYLPALSDWDDIVLDTPPAVGVLTSAALAAADVVIASVACGGEAYEQLDRLDTYIRQRISRMRPGGQTIHWIIPTRYDGRRILDREVVELLEEKYPHRVTHPVREAVAARDSYVSGTTISRYAPDSLIAQDYDKAFSQIITD